MNEILAGEYISSRKSYQGVQLSNRRWCLQRVRLTAPPLAFHSRTPEDSVLMFQLVLVILARAEYPTKQGQAIIAS